jgi:hypothetical protein
MALEPLSLKCGLICQPEYGTALHPFEGLLYHLGGTVKSFLALQAWLSSIRPAN